MRKDSAKGVEETYWIVAPPSGHFWETNRNSMPMWKKHAQHMSSGTSCEDE